MKKIFIGLILLAILIGAVAFIAPMVVPTSAYKSQIEDAATNAIGRPVSFNDDISFKIFPQAAFRVNDLEIGNAEGFNGDFLARVETADIGVKIMPLFQQSVEINRFVLNKPDLNLVRNKNGDVNWNIARADAAETTSEETSQSAPPVFRDLSLGDVRIVEGRAVYADAVAGKTYTADDINMTARLDSLKEPFTLDGSLNFQGEPSTANIILTTPEAILNNKEANLKLDMVLGGAAAGADLTLQAGDTLSYRGPVRVNAPDLPGFTSIFDIALEEAPGFDRLALAGEATGSDTELRIAGAKLTFDEIVATGDFALNWGGAKPKLTGSLNSDLLDLRPYMPPPTESATGFPAWSTDKLDFTSLRNVDANLTVTSEKTYLNELKIDRSRMKITISNGRMTADIPEITMYGGKGSGQLVVNARSNTPSMSGDFDFNALNAQPFSIDMMKTDKLLGLGAMKLKFIASGASQADIMKSVNGEGGFDLADGALKGINIAKLARVAASLQDGLNPAAALQAVTQARGVDETTDFSKFLSNFTITNGLVSAQTISLNGPYLTMTGSGTVNLPGQTIDLRLQPRASTSVDGTEGRMVAIPLRISGTFSEPKASIDVESVVRSRVEEGVRGLIGGALGGGKSDDSDEDENNGGTAESILRGVLGGSKRDTDTNSPDGDASASESSLEESLANEAINRLFGGSGNSGENTTESTDSDDPQ